MTTANTTSWKDFLKSIASFNGDLYTLTAPPFILSPVSLVEYSQFWSEHPDLLVAPNFVDDPVQRQLEVTKWFLSTLRSQYCSRNESLGSEKKPLNPFLGEVFVGKWKTDNEKIGETVLLSEQVSHHPPVTAYSILNEKNETYLTGYNEIKSQIYATSLTLQVKQYGHAILEYKKLNESYLITLPGLHIEGLLMATPYVELDGKSYIVSSNGLITVIEYSGKGWVSGKKNSFKAKIFKDKKAMKSKSTPLYTISGQWSGDSEIYPKSEHKATTTFYKAQDKEPEHLQVKPIEKQKDIESRKAWLEVANAIKEGSYDKIAQAKTDLENAEREKRKYEKENNLDWKVRWFKTVDVKSDATFSQLCEKGGLAKSNVPSGSSESEGSDNGSHWRFDRALFENEKEISLE